MGVIFSNIRGLAPLKIKIDYILEEMDLRESQLYWWGPY